MKFTRIGTLKPLTQENREKVATKRRRRSSCGEWCILWFLAARASVMGAEPGSAQAAAQSAPLSAAQSSSTTHQSTKGINAISDDKRSTTGAAEMKAAQALTTKVLAIGNWTAKATPETRPPVMPFEARDTLRLQLAGKIDQWFAKTDGSGAVFLMNVTDPAEARALLEQLPLGRAGMMTFQYIPMGPLWPLGLLLSEPTK
jgi:hypothetical protein